MSLHCTILNIDYKKFDRGSLVIVYVCRSAAIVNNWTHYGYQIKINVNYVVDERVIESTIL